MGSGRCQCAASLFRTPHLLEFQPRRVIPQLLKAIHCALLGMENMHDDIAVIHNDPLAERVAVEAERALLVVLLDAVLDFAGDGLELRLGCAGADDEKIRER